MLYKQSLIDRILNYFGFKKHLVSLDRKYAMTEEPVYHQMKNRYGRKTKID